MATTDWTPQAAKSDPTPLLERYRLARWVVIGSFLTLFLLVGALIGLAQGNKDVADAAKSAFSTILPVLAGWVGTVLAFYFSAASQERTSASLDKAISQSGPGGGGPGKLVSEKMLPLSSIVGLQKLEEKEGGAKEIPIEELKKAFDATLPNGAKVTRLLFVEGGVFKYILHIGALNAFLVKTQSAEQRPTKFGDMLNDEETLHQISKLVVFVSAAATLGDAKAALDKVSGAQDIIVTGTGNSTDPMLGWLSNVDLTKALQVN
jgi:hypothetical protein